MSDTTWGLGDRPLLVPVRFQQYVGNAPNFAAEHLLAIPGFTQGARSPISLKVDDKFTGEFQAREIAFDDLAFHSGILATIAYGGRRISPAVFILNVNFRRQNHYTPGPRTINLARHANFDLPRFNLLLASLCDPESICMLDNLGQPHFVGNVWKPTTFDIFEQTTGTFATLLAGGIGFFNFNPVIVAEARRMLQQLATAMCRGVVAFDKTKFEYMLGYGLTKIWKVQAIRVDGSRGYVNFMNTSVTIMEDPSSNFLLGVYANRETYQMTLSTYSFVEPLVHSFIYRCHQYFLKSGLESDTSLSVSQVSDIIGAALRISTNQHRGLIYIRGSPLMYVYPTASQMETGLSFSRSQNFVTVTIIADKPQDRVVLFNLLSAIARNDTTFFVASVSGVPLWFLHSAQNHTMFTNGGTLNGAITPRIVNICLALGHLISEVGINFTAPVSTWLNGIQECKTYDTEGLGGGFALAAKALWSKVQPSTGALTFRVI